MFKDILTVHQHIPMYDYPTVSLAANNENPSPSYSPNTYPWSTQTYTSCSSPVYTTQLSPTTPHSLFPVSLPENFSQYGSNVSLFEAKPEEEEHSEMSEDLYSSSEDIRHFFDAMLQLEMQVDKLYHLDLTTKQEIKDTLNAYSKKKFNEMNK